jgi:serine/threonine protein phosphatase PrpC
MVSSVSNDFCAISTGCNLHQKLLTALDEQDMIVLKDFLVDTLGSKTAYDALLATKQTADAIQNKHDFSSDSSSVALHEHALLDFFSKGKPTEEKKDIPLSTTEFTPIKIDGGYTLPNPDHPQRNDDTSFIDTQNLRGGIFDGAGGYAGGDKASQAAMGAIREVMDRFPLKGYFPEGPVREQFLDAFALANERVKALGSGMTTAAAWQVVRSQKDGSPKLLIANVGDSRVWIRHKDGSITQVTRDANELRDLHRKELSSIPSSTDPRFQEERDAEIQHYEGLQRILDSASGDADFAADPRLKVAWDLRNQTSLLGSDDFKERFEFFESPIQEGDTVFATTDGVHDNLSLQQIEEIARSAKDVDSLSQQLVARARAVADTKGQPNQQFRAKSDDITAVATKFEMTTPTEHQSDTLGEKSLDEDDFKRISTSMSLPTQAKEAIIPIGPLYGNMFNDNDIRTLAGKFLGEIYSPLIDRANGQALQDAIGSDEWGPLGKSAIRQFASEIQAINKTREAKGLPPLSFSNDHIGGSDDFHFNGDRSPVTAHLFYFNKATQNYDPPYNPNEGITHAYITLDPTNKDIVAKNFVDLCETLYDAGINFSAKATSPYGTIKRDDNIVIYIRDSDKENAAHLIRSFLTERSIATGHVRAANPDAQDGLSWAPEPTPREVKIFQEITGSTTQGSFNAIVASRLMPYYLASLARQYREIAQREKATLSSEKYQELMTNAQNLDNEAKRTREIIQQSK